MKFKHPKKIQLKWVKSLIMLSAVVLVAPLISGCGSDSSSSSGSITVVTPRPASVDSSHFHNGFIDDKASEQGLSIEWDVKNSSDWGEQKAVLLASGDLPDVFLGALTDSDIEQIRDSIAPLESLIDKDMPNLSEIMKKDKNMKAVVTSPDNHIYSLPSKFPGRPSSVEQMYINKTWLDKLGLEMPQTYEELESALLAFKEKDPNGNGQADEIPWLDSLPRILLPYGMPTTEESYDCVELVDGKPTYLPSTETYKQAVIKLHDDYAKGILDKEMFTRDSNSTMSLYDAKPPVVGVSTTWTADSAWTTTSSEYVPLPALVSPDGKKYANGGNPYRRNQVVIKKDAKDIDKILKWLDNFYTADGTVQAYYGPIGEVVKKNGENDYLVQKPADGKSFDQMVWANSVRDLGPMYGSEDIKVAFEDNVGDGQKLVDSKPLDQYVQKEQFPRVTLGSDEQKEISTIMANILKFKETKFGEWVSKGGVEEGWDAYLAELKSMKLDRMMTILTDGYERYKKINN